MGVGEMGLKKLKPQIKFEVEKLSLVLRNLYLGLIIFAYLFQFGLNPEGVLVGDSVAYGAGDTSLNSLGSPVRINFFTGNLPQTFSVYT